MADTRSVGTVVVVAAVASKVEAAEGTREAAAGTTRGLATGKHERIGIRLDLM